MSVSMFIYIILTCIVLFLFIKWNRLKSYWAQRRVPFLPPYPVVGNMTFLQRQNPALFMKEAYKKFNSPYVGIWVFWRPALVINSPELARKVLVKDFDIFKNRFLSSGKSDPVGGLNLFTVNEPIWSVIRRQLTKVFTASKLKSSERVIVNKTKDLLERIKDKMDKNGVLTNLRDLFVDYTTDVMGEFAFGLTTETTKTGDSLLRNITTQYMKFSLYRGLSWSSIFFCPDLVDIFGFSLFPKSSTRLLRQIFRKVVKQRGGYDRNVSENEDFLDVLLKLKSETAQADHILMTEDLLLAQASIFLVGGFDTTAALLSWATYEMAFEPKCQDKLFKELKQATQQLAGKPLESSILTELPYLNAVIKETLRKYPPLGWLDRISSSEYKIDSNLTLPAGSIVYVNAVGMHMDPHFFPHPEVFNPDRFLPDNEKNIKPYTFLPFGEGPRGCIGKRFAYQTIRYGLASIFLMYRVSPSPGAPRPNDARVETKGMFYMPNEKLPVQFLPTS